MGVRRVAAAQAFDSKKINYCGGCCGVELVLGRRARASFLRLIAKVAKNGQKPAPRAVCPQSRIAMPARPQWTSQRGLRGRCLSERYCCRGQRSALDDDVQLSCYLLTVCLECIEAPICRLQRLAANKTPVRCPTPELQALTTAAVGPRRRRARANTTGPDAGPTTTPRPR